MRLVEFVDEFGADLVEAAKRAIPTGATELASLVWDDGQSEAEPRF